MYKPILPSILYICLFFGANSHGCKFYPANLSMVYCPVVDANPILYIFRITNPGLQNNNKNNHKKLLVHFLRGRPFPVYVFWSVIILPVYFFFWSVVILHCPRPPFSHGHKIDIYPTHFPMVSFDDHPVHSPWSQIPRGTFPHDTNSAQYFFMTTDPSPTTPSLHAGVLFFFTEPKSCLCKVS